MSKTRKQHIENLIDLHNKTEDRFWQDSIQYAIDHLSREWVSRNTHRKLIKMWEKEVDDYIDQYLKLSIEAKEMQSEIDQLKIDKDMLQTTLSSKLNIIDEWDMNARAARDTWNSQLNNLSNKATRYKNKVKWLSITTAILTIVLIISLFKCH